MRLTEEDKVEFRQLYPHMRIVPSLEASRVYEGEFRFIGSTHEWGTVEDSYRLRISIDPKPDTLPRVWETAGRVAQIDPTHVNYGSDGLRTGTLCLGSYLRLRLAIGHTVTLVEFAKKCIVPYLYAISLRERGEPSFVFGELAHGDPGLLQDYEQIFGLEGLGCVTKALQLTAKRRRVANKKPCPCGCGRRLAKCQVHHRINALRKLAPRHYFKMLTDGERLIAPATEA